MQLKDALRAWGRPDFEAILKQEIERLGAGQLPLQRGLSTGNYVADEPYAVTINSVTDQGNMIRVKAGIFYMGVLGGCSCIENPEGASDINEYCEVQLDIDKTTGATTIALVAENPA